MYRNAKFIVQGWDILKLSSVSFICNYCEGILYLTLEYLLLFCCWSRRGKMWFSTCSFFDPLLCSLLAWTSFAIFKLQVILMAACLLVIWNYDCFRKTCMNHFWSYDCCTTPMVTWLQFRCLAIGSHIQWLQSPRFGIMIWDLLRRLPTCNQLEKPDFLN